MACNNADFDVSKYMIYLRDMDISEQQCIDILQDTLYEIAYETKIFKDLFTFNIESCDNVYDIKVLYNISQAMKLDVTTVVSTDYTEQQLINILEGKEFPDPNSNDGCDTNEQQDSDNDIKDNSECLNTYMNVIDIVWYNKNNLRDPIVSVIQDWFTLIGNDIYELRPDNVSKDTGISVKEFTLLDPIPVVALVSVIPNITNLSSDDEKLLRPALIAGLKYKVSDMYLNTANEQVSNLLFQRYYNAKKQLAFTFPQFVSNQRIKNPNWNY